ncbi:hypothetical protein M8J77_024414 [Diaphorina citri]|nr:hypothetical protein M8J77_024414 [Diaphorina citri]
MVVDVEEVELLGTADKACQVQILKPQPPKPHVRSKAIQTDIISKTKPKKAVVPPSLTDYLSPEKNMVAATEAVQDTSFHLSDIEENTSDSGSSDSIDAHLYLSYNLKLMLRKPRYYLGLDLENVKLIDHLSKFVIIAAALSNCQTPIISES